MPHRKTHQSCYNRHGEHINPGLTREHINAATIAMENTSIEASQENTPILLHRKANHLVHKRANHLVPQESESSYSSAQHQGRVSHPVVVCCSSKNRKPPELPELNVCNMLDPFTKVSRRLQVVRENHKFDLSLGL